MNPEEVRWILNAAPGMIWLGLGVFVLYLFTTLYHLRQVGFGSYRLLTEALKFLGALLLLFTLLQPEIHKRTRRHENARIAVITDATESMTTRDVQTGGETLTRKEWIDRLMQGEVWQRLAAEVELDLVEMGHEEEAVLKETNLTAALATARQRDQLAAILVLSDGVHNALAPPLPEILRLAEARVPAYAVEIGAIRRLPDLVLDAVKFPSYSIMNEAVVLPVKVSNTLPEDAPVRISLLANGQTVASTEMMVASGKSAENSLRWVPRVAGSVALTVVVEPHPLEVFTDNNQLSADVDIRKTTIRVLLIDSLPRWEYRFLRNALVRDPGVVVDSLLFHPGLGPQTGPGFLSVFPPNREAWSSYDVVFLGDVGVGEGELTLEDANNLEILVREQGSGLVFLPGPRGGQLRLRNTALGDLNPVEYDSRLPNGVGLDLEMRMSLTREGNEHMLTQLHGSPGRNRQIWTQIPGFNWYAGVSRARVGAEVLATHSSHRNENGRIPLLATRNAGTGHLLFLGTDAAWRWRRGVEDLYHYRFWGQVVRWMAHKRHMFGDEGARVFLQPERPKVGQEVTMTISLRGAVALDATIPFRLRLGHEMGEVLSPAVEALEGGGTYQVRWVPKDPGKMTLELFSLDNAQEAWFRTQFNVEGEVLEKVGDPMQPTLLRELVQITGGERSDMESVDLLLEKLRQLPRQQTVLSINRLWQHPLWVIFVFLFFGLYWILRKRQGWI